MGKSWQGFALGGGEPNPRSLCTGSLSSLPNLIPPLTGAGIFPLWGQESLHLYPRKSLEMPCSRHPHTSWCGVRMGWRVQSRKNKTQPFLTRAIKFSIARWVIGLYSSSKALNSHSLSSSLPSQSPPPHTVTSPPQTPWTWLLSRWIICDLPQEKTSSM